jgi:hypothetical protein
MTQQYVRKKHKVEAKQWFEHGDHDMVIPVPVEHDFWDSPEGRHGALRFGYLESIDGGQLVMPGDYIVKEHVGQTPYYKAIRSDIFPLLYSVYSRGPAYYQGAA